MQAIWQHVLVPVLRIWVMNISFFDTAWTSARLFSWFSFIVFIFINVVHIFPFLAWHDYILIHLVCSSRSSCLAPLIVFLLRSRPLLDSLVHFCVMGSKESRTVSCSSCKTLEFASFNNISLFFVDDRTYWYRFRIYCEELLGHILLPHPLHCLVFCKYSTLPQRLLSTHHLLQYFRGIWTSLSTD